MALTGLKDCMKRWEFLDAKYPTTPSEQMLLLAQIADYFSTASIDLTVASTALEVNAQRLPIALQQLFRQVCSAYWEGIRFDLLLAANEGAIDGTIGVSRYDGCFYLEFSPSKRFVIHPNDVARCTINRRSVGWQARGMPQMKQIGVYAGEICGSLKVLAQVEA